MQPTGGHEPRDPWAAPRQGYAVPGERPHAPAPPPWAASGPQHPQGTTAMTLGILSLCGLWFLGPLAWAMSHAALREVDASPVPAANRGQLVCGKVTGIISTVFFAGSVLWFLFAVAIIVGIGAS